MNLSERLLNVSVWKFCVSCRTRVKAKAEGTTSAHFCLLLFCLHFLTEKGSVSGHNFKPPLPPQVVYGCSVFSVHRWRPALGPFPCRLARKRVSVTSWTSGELTENWASVEILTWTVRELLKHTFISAHELWHLNWKKLFFYLKTVEVPVGCSFVLWTTWATQTHEPQICWCLMHQGRTSVLFPFKLSLPTR